LNKLNVYKLYTVLGIHPVQISAGIPAIQSLSWFTSAPQRKHRDNTSVNATILSEKTLSYNNLIVHKLVTITKPLIDIYWPFSAIHLFTRHRKQPEFSLQISACYW